MKKINLGFYIPVLMVLFFYNCKKPKQETPVPSTGGSPVVQPPPSTQSQPYAYATYANLLVSDVEMICSFIGEDASVKPLFYKEQSLGSGTTTVIRDLATSRVSITFNHTTCNDGRVRDGAIFIFFKEPQYAQHPITGNENYIRDYNYTGRITLDEYKVDGWLVEDKDFTVFIKNLRPNALTPLAGKLHWSFEGEFKMKKNQDSMSWKGIYVKTLENTSDPLVFNPNTQSAINWGPATISYTGQATGTTFSNVPYVFRIDQGKPLKRDFSCSPDAVSTTTLTATYPGFHPFTSGVVSFTSGVSTPMKIFYSNIYNIEPPPCDNIATVQLNGMTTSFTMWK